MLQRTNHSCEDHTSGPAVNPVVVLGVGEVEFGGLVVGGGHLGVVLLGGEVVLAESEVDQLQLLRLVVDQHVEGLYVSVHYPVGVDVVKGLA